MKNTLSLESQFEVERLKRYLKENPEKGIELAIEHFEDYLFVVQEYKKLKEKYNSSPSLPTF